MWNDRELRMGLGFNAPSSRLQCSGDCIIKRNSPSSRMEYTSFRKTKWARPFFTIPPNPIIHY